MAQLPLRQWSWTVITFLILSSTIPFLNADTNQDCEYYCPKTCGLLPSNEYNACHHVHENCKCPINSSAQDRSGQSQSRSSFDDRHDKIFGMTFALFIVISIVITFLPCLIAGCIFCCIQSNRTQYGTSMYGRGVPTMYGVWDPCTLWRPSSVLWLSIYNLRNGPKIPDE